MATAAMPGGAQEGLWKRNLLFIWIGVFVGLVGANFVFPFIPFYIEDLGVSDDSQVAFLSGVTASMAGLSLTITAPIWGAMADRYGRKPMFLRALVGAGVLIGLMGIVTAVWQLIFLRFLMGAFAGTMGAAAALVASSTPREKMGYALGTLQTGQFAANMLGPVLGGVAAASLGIRESFFFCAALYAVAAGMVYIYVREGAPPETAAAQAGATKEPAGGLIHNLKAVLTQRQVLLMLVLLFVLWLSTTFVRPVMPISIQDFADAGDGEHVELHFFGWGTTAGKEAATGYAFGVIGLTSTIAAFMVAPLGERLGYRNTVAGAAVMTGLMFPLVALADSPSMFMVALGAVGLFQGAMVPGTNALIAASSPEGKQGSTFGLAASMQSMALLLGPLGGGATSSLAGIDAVYVSIGVMIALAGAVAMLLIREPERFGAQTREVVTV